MHLLLCDIYFVFFLFMCFVYFVWCTRIGENYRLSLVLSFSGITTMNLNSQRRTNRLISVEYRSTMLLLLLVFYTVIPHWIAAWSVCVQFTGMCVCLFVCVYIYVGICMYFFYTWIRYFFVFYFYWMTAASIISYSLVRFWIFASILVTRQVSSENGKWLYSGQSWSFAWE